MRSLLLLPTALLLGATTSPSAPTTRPGDQPPPAPRDSVREYRGVYETGFEVSWFRPCDAPAGDDRWWVTLTDPALRQRDSLARALPGAPRAVFVRWRGATSARMPLGAGHMGRGSRYLLVSEILELRAADDASCGAV